MNEENQDLGNTVFLYGNYRRNSCGGSRSYCSSHFGEDGWVGISLFFKHIFSYSLSWLRRNQGYRVSAAGKALGQLSCTSLNCLRSGMLSLFYGVLQCGYLYKERDVFSRKAAFWQRASFGRRHSGGGPVGRKTVVWVELGNPGQEILSNFALTEVLSCGIM